MTVEENRSIVADAFADWAAGKRSFFDLLADDVVWTVIGSGPAAGRYEGRATFLGRIVAPFAAQLAGSLEPTLRSVWADGDVVIARWSSRASTTNGAEYRNDYVFILTMRNGLAVTVEEFLDLPAFERVWTAGGAVIRSGSASTRPGAPPMTHPENDPDKYAVVDAVAPKLRDHDKPFTLLVDLVVRAEAQKRFEALCARLIPPTRAEAGCLMYRLDRDLERSRHYVLSESWRSLDALRTHFDAEHTAGVLKDLGGMLEGSFTLRVLVPVADEQPIRR